MLIYIFKGRDGKRLVASEKEAHNKLRTLSNWERQDLKYLGACEDTITANARDRREKALKMVIDESPEIKTLNLELKVATLEKKKKQIDLLNSKRELIEANIEASINKVGTLEDMPTQKDDIARAKYLKFIEQLYEAEIDALEPNSSIIPRDFSRVEHKFSGREAGIQE